MFIINKGNLVLFSCVGLLDRSKLEIDKEVLVTSGACTKPKPASYLNVLKTIPYAIGSLSRRALKLLLVIIVKGLRSAYNNYFRVEAGCYYF